jgi:flotillin
LRQQAQYERDTEIARAKNAAEVNMAQADADRASQIAQAQAEADEAGPLAQAEAEQAVFEAQPAAAAKQAALREQERVGERVKPAEADAEAVRIKAQADSEATKLQAEAAASNDRVALERMIIEQQPELVSNAGSSLAKANVTVLNGSDGLSQIAAGLVSQRWRSTTKPAKGSSPTGTGVVSGPRLMALLRPHTTPSAPTAPPVRDGPTSPSDQTPAGRASL